MAPSTSTVHLTTNERPAFAVQPLKQETADRTTQLLQENHDVHHVFLNDLGFHNHIAHHLLTLYALSGTPEQIQNRYDANRPRQRPAMEVHERVVAEIRDPAVFTQHLGDERYYRDYLVFFQDELAARGTGPVLEEYLFKGNERADAMFRRLYAGALHPIIHLGFGVEFEQPALLAEGLAQTAVHGDEYGAFLNGAEKVARESLARNAAEAKKTTLAGVLDEIGGNEVLRSSVTWEDGEQKLEAMIERVPDEICKVAGRWIVGEEELERKTAEMINTAVYFAATAQHPPHIPKFDFFQMHSVTCSIFFTAFLRAGYISTAAKIRLLEYKGRMDIALYTSRGSPRLLPHYLSDYRPKHPEHGWAQIFERACNYADDGHAPKLIRGIRHGMDVSAKWVKEGRVEFRVRGEDVFLRIAHMAIDSVEARGPEWVRSAGFARAWEGVPLM